MALSGKFILATLATALAIGEYGCRDGKDMQNVFNHGSHGVTNTANGFAAAAGTTYRDLHVVDSAQGTSVDLMAPKIPKGKNVKEEGACYRGSGGIYAEVTYDNNQVAILPCAPR